MMMKKTTTTTLFILSLAATCDAFTVLPQHHASKLSSSATSIAEMDTTMIGPTGQGSSSPLSPLSTGPMQTTVPSPSKIAQTTSNGSMSVTQNDSLSSLLSSSLPATPSTPSTSKPSLQQQQQQQQQQQSPSPSPRQQKNMKPKKTTKNQHQEGIFSPLVHLAKKVLGEERLNKIRAKAIALHSDVIGNFVSTAESEFGVKVLRSLFDLADSDKSGTIEQKELGRALHALGFDFLKDKQIAGIFSRADSDGSGGLDFEEWKREAPKTLRTNLIKLAKKNGGELGFLV